MCALDSSRVSVLGMEKTAGRFKSIECREERQAVWHAQEWSGSALENSDIGTLMVT